MPGELKADLAAAWLRELELRGAYGYEHDFPARAGVRRATLQARPPDRPRLAAARVQEGARAGAARPRAPGRVKTVFEMRAHEHRRPTRMIERSKRRQPAAEREACVVEVHENSPPTLFHSGESFRLERLPGRLADRLPAAAAEGPDRRRRGDRRRARLARSAWTRSTRCCSPGMKLTIAFDDISLPLPPMSTPDIRGRVIEHVLERAYRAGVDDIHLIAALALHRRMTPAELKRAVGAARLRRVLSRPALQPRRRGPGRRSSSSARPRHGEAVELSKRAAESDLLVYVNINLVTMDGGHKSVAVGLGTYNSAASAHHNVARDAPLAQSFMDPSASPSCTTRAGRQGEIVEAAVPIFHIETTLNNDMFDGPLRVPGQARGALDAARAGDVRRRSSARPTA